MNSYFFKTLFFMILYWIFFRILLKCFLFIYCEFKFFRFEVWWIFHELMDLLKCVLVDLSMLFFYLSHLFGSEFEFECEKYEFVVAVILLKFCSFTRLKFKEEEVTQSQISKLTRRLNLMFFFINTDQKYQSD